MFSLVLVVIPLVVMLTPVATGWELLALPLAFAVGQLAVLVGLVVGGRR